MDAFYIKPRGYSIHLGKFDACSNRNLLRKICIISSTFKLHCRKPFIISWISSCFVYTPFNKVLFWFTPGCWYHTHLIKVKLGAFKFLCTGFFLLLFTHGCTYRLYIGSSSLNILYDSMMQHSDYQAFHIHENTYDTQNNSTPHYITWTNGKDNKDCCTKTHHPRLRRCERLRMCGQGCKYIAQMLSIWHQRIATSMSSTTALRRP